MAWGRAFRDPEDTESGARFVFALEGRHREQVFQRFAADPGGATILREERSLGARLADREGLHALAPGSLGRAYVEFMDREQLSTEGLALATEPAREQCGLDADRRLVEDRIRDLHDLWHVVTGYSRDILGEVALIVFSYRQLGTRAFAPIAAISYLFMEFRIPGARALLRGAWQRAGSAPWLPVENWETLLERPLDEVRETLGVGPAPVYTRHFRVGRALVPERAA
jgi:ubiquinone biosynthesis protein COQ4